MIQPQDVGDRAQHVDGGVVGADQRGLLDVGADHERRAAVRVDVVGAVLGVVLDDEDQGVVGIRALGDRLDQASDGVIVVSDLNLRCVDSVDGGAEVAGVVVHQTHQAEVGQIAAADVAVELALPLLLAVEVRVVVVETAEVDVRQRRQVGIGRIGLHRFAGEGRAVGRDLQGGLGSACQVIARQVDEEAVVAHAQVSPQRRVPQVTLL